ncbi:GNAT family protein [Cryptosporidium ubiquitum]|uniref:N-alpha-acetyltransferase 40 n=1 Tax=Cryptosporidium ubiquitum TaxID=857276 RepID=A0A1J4MFN5_9CRYT|nr:GNAT family protein [Cryptosporidium ubiquitum]OII73074.1 GNAT family protein [Cryptosporidium ubiquitum]
MTQVIKDRKISRKKAIVAYREKKYKDLVGKILKSKDFFSNLFQDSDLIYFKTELTKISNYSNLHIARSSDLSDIHIEKILKITRDNMKILYDENPWGDIWSRGWDDSLKMNELKHYMCNYMIIYERNMDNTVINTIKTDRCSEISFHNDLCSDINILSFLSFRFELEDEIGPINKQIVGYMYELQSSVKRKGYGKLLIDLLFFICNKLKIKKIMCTVLRRNIDAMRFYTKKCGFNVDKISPSLEPYIILSTNTM